MNKLQCNEIYIIPTDKVKPIKIVYDYGKCPNCNHDLVGNGRYAIWDENEEIIDKFDRAECLFCNNTWFVNGKGKFEFTNNNEKLIYTCEDNIIEFELIEINYKSGD